MVINSLKAVFFIGGGAVVAAGAAYVTGALDIFFPENQTAVASLPSPQATPMAPAAQPEPAKPEVAAPKVEQPASPAPQEAAQPKTDAAPGVVIPSFDLVRVEPDGSLVIAGRAAPAATVEIVAGNSTVGRGEANETGEFAIVLDVPLEPGDYTIVLRATTRDAVAATSAETAIVSIPDNEHGQVLALVEQPGAPSRLITVPQAAAPKQNRPVAAEKPAAEKPAAEAGQMAAAPAAPAAEAAKSQAPAASAETAAAPQAAEKPVQEEKPAEQVASAATEQPKPEEPAAGEQQAAQQPAGSAPVAGAATAEAKPAEPESQQMAAAQPQPAQEQAAAQRQPAQEPAAAQPQAPAERPRIAVEAVEIEGRRVFVAGRAEVGARVRVYANDILLGDAQTSDGGRFLVEAERDLPVGDYIVRADLLGRNAEVVARAAVPFEREPGEAVAAVAAPEPQPMVQQPAAAQPAPQAGVTQPQPEPAKPAETAAATGTVRPQAGAGQPAAQKPAVEAAAPAAQGEKPAEQQTASAPAAVPATQGGETPAVGEQVASAPATAPAAAPASGAAGQQPAAGEQMASAPAAQPSTGEAMQQPAGSAAGEQAASQEVTAPKLQNVAGAVIIRRGDTLWRISKRVYGRGVRYTTIYLANQQQIEDPDRIWPGQVFSVPDKTDSGENADMSAVADRAPDAQTETR